MSDYLVDTNCLLRFVQATDPQHGVVRAAMRQLRRARHRLCFTPQNAVELWNVATRPATRNGLGLTAPESQAMLQQIERLFTLLPDSPAIYPLWRRLVSQLGVSGVQVHDARLVAVMQAHGVAHLLTFNGADFARYAPLGIEVVNPGTV